jgi:hypothetical protein
MKTKGQILSEITDLTNKIETDYPELYGFLEEDPTTIPSIAHPDLSESTLTEYLESLKELVKHHLETHINKKI